MTREKPKKAPAEQEGHEGEEKDQDQEEEEQRQRGRTTTLTEEEQKNILYLFSKGKIKLDIANELGIPYDKVKRFLRGKEPPGGAAAAAVTEKGAEQVAAVVAQKKFMQVTTGAALEASTMMAEIGTFVWETYREDARLLGLDVTEYLVRAVTFYKTQREHIEQLLEEKRGLEDLVERQRKLLAPVPYRLVALLEMIRRGDDFDELEIDAFLGIGVANERS